MTMVFVDSTNELHSIRGNSTDAIRLRAYQKWEIAGKPGGEDIRFWMEAEKELLFEKEDTSGRGNSQDADRHSQIRHPRSTRL